MYRPSYAPTYVPPSTTPKKPLITKRRAIVTACLVVWVSALFTKDEPSSQPTHNHSISTNSSYDTGSGGGLTIARDITACTSLDVSNRLMSMLKSGDRAAANASLGALIAELS